MSEHEQPSPLEVLRSAERAFADVGEERDEPFRLRLLPVNTAPGSIRFQPGAPRHLRDLASYAGGYELESERVRWDPPLCDDAVDLPGAIDDPWGLEEDGGGSFSAIDISPEGVWGGVYRFVRDPDLLAFESPDLGSWLDARLQLHLALTPLARADDPWPYRQQFYDLFACPPGVPGARDLSLGPAGDIDTPDPVLREFCAILPPDAHVADFRAARRGDWVEQFPLGFGDLWIRAGSLPLFAVLPGTAPAVPPGLPGLPPLPPRTFGRQRD